MTNDFYGGIGMQAGVVKRANAVESDLGVKGKRLSKT